MKYLLASILLLLAACTKTPIQPAAMSATQPKIATLDIQKAVTSTREGIVASAGLHRQFDPDIKKFEQERLDIERLRQQALNRNVGTDLPALTNEIDSRQRSYNRDTEDVRQRFEVEQKRVLKGLTAKLMAVAGEYAKQNNFSVVVDPSNVLWRADQTDITDKVIALYDLKYR
jgi:Skp family chaperone for outer membrane proteins